MTLNKDIEITFHRYDTYIKLSASGSDGFLSPDFLSKFEALLIELESFENVELSITKGMEESEESLDFSELNTACASFYRNDRIPD